MGEPNIPKQRDLNSVVKEALKDFVFMHQESGDRLPQFYVLTGFNKNGDTLVPLGRFLDDGRDYLLGPEHLNDRLATKEKIAAYERLTKGSE